MEEERVRRIYYAILLLPMFAAGVMSGMAEAADLIWQLSKSDTVALAHQEGKKILLVAGRAT